MYNSFAAIEPPSGWAGSHTSGPPEELSGDWANPEAMAVIQQYGDQRVLHQLCSDLQSIRPPFVDMKSPQGTILSIKLECHWLLMFALMLNENFTGAAKFKVMQKNKRKMTVTLAQSGVLGLMRDDQEQQYNIQWSSRGMQDFWLGMRNAFRQVCNGCPEQGRAIQFGFLNLILEALPVTHLLKAQIVQYCYSTNAWLCLRDGILAWKVADENQHAKKSVAFEDLCTKTVYDKPKTRTTRGAADTSSESLLRTPAASRLPRSAGGRAWADIIDVEASQECKNNAGAVLDYCSIKADHINSLNEKVLKGVNAMMRSSKTPARFELVLQNTFLQIKSMPTSRKRCSSCPPSAHS